MKKNILLAMCLSFLLSSLAFAATVSITSNELRPLPHTEKLLSVPQEVLGILLDQGLKLTQGMDGVYNLKVDNIHCDYRHRGADETEIGGIPTQTCQINGKEDLKEARALTEILSKIEREMPEIYFTDCAMGYCSTDVLGLACSVDTKITGFFEGRFSCSFSN